LLLSLIPSLVSGSAIPVSKHGMMGISSPVVVPPAESQLLSAYANNGTVSTTNVTDDTFTSTTGSAYQHSCSGIEATTATGSVEDVDGYFLGFTDTQGSYCGGNNELFFAWKISNNALTASGESSNGTCGSSVFGAVTIKAVSRFRLVKTDDTCKWYLDLDGDDSWVLKGTFTDTGNIPTVYLAVTLESTGKSVIWSSV
jgi:hypothetical protein